MGFVQTCCGCKHAAWCQNSRADRAACGDYGEYGLDFSITLIVLCSIVLALASLFIAFIGVVG